jgi:hypothetical protein
LCDATARLPACCVLNLFVVIIFRYFKDLKRLTVNDLNREEIDIKYTLF